MRAGALAAPMEIIEERTVGPSMGEENIKSGVNSTLWGFAAIASHDDALLHAVWRSDQLRLWRLTYCC